MAGVVVLFRILSPPHLVVIDLKIPGGRTLPQSLLFTLDNRSPSYVICRTILSQELIAHVSTSLHRQSTIDLLTSLGIPSLLRSSSQLSVPLDQDLQTL